MEGRTKKELDELYDYYWSLPSEEGGQQRVEPKAEVSGPVFYKERPKEVPEFYYQQSPVGQNHLHEMYKLYEEMRMQEIRKRVNGGQSKEW